MTHGRYSRIKRERIKDLIAEFADDPDPLDLRPELGALRGLFVDWIERYDEYTEALIAWHESFNVPELESEEDELERMKARNRKPRRVLDISDGYRLLSEATKVAQRIETVKAQNAISRSDLGRILLEMTRVVEMEVRDDGIKQRIRDGWQSIRLA